MQAISVVIICKNESHIIGRTLQSLQGLTDDIVLYDNGSTDGTQEIVKASGARLYEGEWLGFGATKQKAISLAKYDWILSLDADEAIDDELKSAILELALADKQTVFEFRFWNYMGNKVLMHGEWGNDSHIRLFNRDVVHWDQAAVHEKLVIPKGTIVKKIRGHVLHYTALDLGQYARKMSDYATLNAKKYFQQGKKSSAIRSWISPAFSFLRNYVFKLGFLDGRAGYTCAKISANYTFMKYRKLRELNRSNKGN